MRNFISKITVLMLIVSVISCNSNSKKVEGPEGYRVYGNLEGVEDGQITLNLYNHVDRTSQVLDSTTITNGTFEFTGEIENPDEVTLLAGNTRIKFILENAEIKIEADVSEVNAQSYEPVDADISGSPLNDLYREQKEKEDAIVKAAKYNDLIKLQEAYSEAQQNRDVEKSRQLYAEFEKFSELSETRTQELLSEKINFIKKHPGSPVSPVILEIYYFGERSMTLDQIEEVFTTFSGDAKNTMIYKYFEDEYNALKRTSPGAKAPDFTLKSPTGEEISLSDIQDKYILIDFWASWCKPCRESYPHLKEVYKKYKNDGFEVLAVSTDNDHDKWKKAIEEDQTKWVHVVDTFNRPGFPSDIGTLYAVPFLPTTYLLDKEGKIMAKNLSEQELDNKLMEIFGY